MFSIIIQQWKSCTKNRIEICILPFFCLHSKFLYAVLEIKTHIQSIQKHSEAGTKLNGKRPQPQSHTRLNESRRDFRVWKVSGSVLYKWPLTINERWLEEQMVFWSGFRLFTDLMRRVLQWQHPGVGGETTDTSTWKGEEREKHSREGTKKVKKCLPRTNRLNPSHFQTLHMKEEENKRLSQRLVSPRSCELCCTCSSRWQ